MTARLRALLFDFGGVLAEEGFREGLQTLARRFGLDPQRVYEEGAEAVYASGYVVGRGSERDFWNLLGRRTGLPPFEPGYTRAILERFVLRPRMLAAVRELRRRGYLAAILSDQTDWLDRLEARDHFFSGFDRVFNSYHLGRGKRDEALFTEVLRALAVTPPEALFIDDNPGHIRRAAACGLRTCLFRDQSSFLSELPGLLGHPLPVSEEQRP